MKSGIRNFALVALSISILATSGCASANQGNLEACKLEQINFKASGEALTLLNQAKNSDAAIASAKMSKVLADKAVDLASGDLKKYLGYESLFWESLTQKEFPNEILDKIPDDFSIKKIENICGPLGVNIRN